MQDGTAVLPASPSLAPRGSAPPPTGRGLGAGWPVGSGSTALHHLPPQNTTRIGSNSPSWADVVRNGPRLSPSPPAATTISSASRTADFLVLYECCISSGLTARIKMINLAGVQEERWLNGGGEVVQWRRRGGSMEEERWLNGSTPDCKSVVLGSNPAPPSTRQTLSVLGWVATWDDTEPCAGL